jgi:hypothetical protein
MTYRRPVAVAILALAGCLWVSDGQRGLRSSASRAPSAVRSPVALVLLDDHRLVRISLRRGAVDRTIDLGPRPTGTGRLGGLLGLTSDHRTAQALVGDRIVAVDAADLTRRATHPLEPGVRYRGLVAGASGTVYAYGDRRTRSGWWQVVVTRVGASRRTAVVRAAERLPGVYWGAISADERRLLLSYHGGPDGADWFEVSPRGFERCEPPHRRVDLRRHPRCLWSAGGGLHVHGAVAPSGTGFLAATGQSRLIALDADGGLAGDWDPRTGDAHLMNFALDGERGRVVVASCEGIGIVELAGGRVRVLPRRRACGETPLAVHGDRVLLARGRRLAIVDLGRGREVSRLTLPAAPIAAVVADPSRLSVTAADRIVRGRALGA